MTSSANYFLSELAYSAANELRDCKPLSLHVMTLGDDSSVHIDSASMNMCPSTVQEPSPVNMHCMNVKANHSLSESCAGHIESNKCRETLLGDERYSASDSAVAANKFVDVHVAVQRLSKILTQDCKSDCFILDIDLDFFSTVNPFLSLYTAQQYQLLSELYAYTPPPDSSIEVCLLLFFAHWYFIPRGLEISKV